jgi:purine-binding chemotaxis protein CheW
MSENTQRQDASQYLTFRACQQDFALPILRVREIIEHRPPSRVPGALPWVAGVINLRGKVIPVVDLALRFGLAPSVVGRRACIVIVEAAVGGAELVVGLIAESVCEVVELERSAIEPAPVFGTPLPAEYLRGLGKLGQGFVLVLDVDRAFDVAPIENPAAALDAATA